ncbi:C6 zinc finger domain protein, partial [Metarhizium majus ARSEF 297]
MADAGAAQQTSPPGDANIPVRSKPGDAANHLRKKRWAPKTRTGCLTCRLRRVKCDEEKPYCRRCRRLGYVCHGYKESAHQPETNQQHVAKQMTTLELYQPPVVVSPVQVTATPQELDIFYYYRTEVAAHRADEFNRTLWNVYILRAANDQPAVWHACNALAAVHQRDAIKLSAWNATQAALTVERRQHLYTFALQQHAMSLKHVMAMAQQGDALSFNDKGSILAANLLFFAGCLHQGRLLESLVHLRNGINLMHQWKFWEARAPDDVGSPPQIRNSIFPSASLLLFYVQIDGLAQDSSPPDAQGPEPNSTWQWEPALSSLCKRPFFSPADACLEFEMIWIGLRDLFKTLPPRPDASQQSSIIKRRVMLNVHLQNWKTKMDALQYSSPYVRPSDRKLLTILNMRHILANILANVDIGKFEVCWDAFEAQFEEIIVLVESLLFGQGGQNAHGNAEHRLSFTPTVTKSLHYMATICRHPSLRRRAISLLKELRRAERVGGKNADVSFFTQSIQAIMHMEEEAWFDAEKRRHPGCHCVAGEFICNAHRVSEFQIKYADSQEGELIFRTVDDVVNNRPARSLAMNILIAM